MTNYEQQAADFLASTKTEFSIVFQFTGPYFQGEKELRDVYRFTLKNSKGEYSGTFGDSMNNTQKRAYAAKNSVWYDVEHDPKARTLGIKSRKEAIIALNAIPSAYDVLACLEKYQPDTFANWVADCGYNDQPLSEYPAVMAVYTACVEQYKSLARIFTPEQLEAMQEIS